MTAFMVRALDISDPSAKVAHIAAASLINALLADNRSNVQV